MNIGDTFKINNRKYKVIDILKKENYEQDLIICVTDLNYKECFQRFDLEGGQAHERVRGWLRCNYKWRKE